MAKLDKIMEPLSDANRRQVLDHMIAAWRRPLSGTERTRRWRDGASTENGDAPSAKRRDGTSAEQRDVSSTETRDEASRIPPHPPVVSSSLRGFDSFWSNYPKQVGKGKAEESWKKRNCSKILEKILDALQKQREYITRDGGKFIPNPATWLNQKRWDDTPPQPSFLSEKTSGNAAAARAFVEGKTGHDEPR